MARRDWVWWTIGAAVLLSGGLSMIPGNIRRLAYAIAIAERGSTEIDSGFVKRNNPGDIVQSGSLVTYPTLADGWNALYRQLEMIFNGSSSYYSPDMSIRQMAVIYTGNDQPESWAANVASVLGVSPDTKLLEI